MTDNEIIKAFQYCFTNDFGKTNCYKCAFYTATAKCMDDMQNAVIDLINRQKVEIERLQKSLEEAVSCFNRMESLYKIKCKELEIAKSEAIKDFAERLKEKLQWDVEFDNKLVFESDIDNLLKEMEGSE